MNHVTFDLETLGNNWNAPIVQIGAVCFNIHGEVLSEFSVQIDLKEHFYLFKADISTIEWWLSQTAAIPAVFKKEQRLPLSGALNSFTQWCKTLQGKTKYWSHATFDPPILINAFDKMNIECPIHYRDFMDIRTLNHLAGEVDAGLRDGVHHDALADSRFQAKYISAMIRKLNILKGIKNE